MRSATRGKVHQVVLGLVMATSFLLAVEGVQRMDDEIHIRLVSGHEDRCDLTVREGRDLLEVRTHGRVTLNDQLPHAEGPHEHPVHPERNARFRVKAREGRLVRRLEVRAGDDGEPTYDYQVDGESKTFDAPARRWLEDVVLTCFRVGGVDAERRSARLLEAGGVEAVLGEIKFLDGDEAAGRYFLTLLPEDPITEISDDEISDDELEKLLSNAAKTLATDHWQQRVLRAVPPDRLASATVASAYFRAARTLGGDVAQSSALEHAAEAPLPPEGWSAFFETSLGISSDHELARLLEVYAARDLSPLPKGVEKALGSIDSDVPQSTAIEALLSRPSAQSGEADRLFQVAARHLSNDHEASRLVISWAAKRTEPPILSRGLKLLVRSIDGDEAQFQALHELLAHPQLTTDEADQLLKIAARDVASDRTASEILRSWARRQDQGIKALDGALELLRSISSDHAQGEAASALIKAASLQDLPRLLHAIDISDDHLLADLLLRAAPALTSSNPPGPELGIAFESALRSISHEPSREEVRAAWQTALATTGEPEPVSEPPISSIEPEPPESGPVAEAPGSP